MRDTSRSCAADRSKFVGCRIAPAGGLSIPNALRRGRRRLILLPGTHRLPRAIRITANATFLGGSAASGPTAAVPAPPAAAPRVCGRWAFAGGEGALTRLALDNNRIAGWADEPGSAHPAAGLTRLAALSLADNQVRLVISQSVRRAGRQSVGRSVSQ